MTLPRFALFAVFWLIYRRKAQRHAVYAVPQPRRRRPILEHMTEMATALAAMDFCALHSMAAVGRGSNGALERSEKARPACSALEFPFSLEQRLTTSGATESAGAMFGEQRTRAWRLRSMSPQHRILLRCQRAPPFLVCFLDRELIRLHDVR